MTVVAFVVAVLAIYSQIVTCEVVSWGVALLILAILFRLFWRLATSHNK